MRWAWAAALAALALAAGCEEPPGIWHFPAMTHRTLVQAWALGNGGSARPVLAEVDLGGALSPPLRCRVWDLGADEEATAQFADGLLAIDPGEPLPPGGSRSYLVYFGEGAAVEAESSLRADARGRVTTPAYVAQIACDQGGVLKSLRLKDQGREVEMLADDGAAWWFNRNPRISQARLGTVSPRIAAEGPLFVTVRITHRGILGKRNSMTTDYRFFRDCIDVDHHYERREPARLDWLKLPLTLRPTGSAPAVHSSGTHATRPCLTRGRANRLLADPAWHHVSYGGQDGFGMGVVARQVHGGLWFLDSVGPREHESVYAEPFEQDRAVDISEDFDVRLTYVPHAAGAEGWRHTVRFLPGLTRAEVGELQAKGERQLDIDNDGLGDIEEARRGSNPRSSDTDLDGLSDQDDGEPLQARPREPTPLPSFQPAPSAREQTEAKLATIGGVPTLVIAGEPVGPMAFCQGAMTDEQMTAMADAGFQLHVLAVGGVGWADKQLAVQQRLDRQVEAFLDAVPGAYLVLRCYLCAPPGFARKHAEEALTFEDGSRQHFTRWHAVGDQPEADRGYPSFASQVWREGTASALYDYVSHVRQARYADRVVGYLLDGGDAHGWGYWGSYDRSEHCLDFSEPMLRDFRRTLQRDYQGSVPALRAAWGDGRADFATAMPPPVAQRRRASFGYFWDPATSRRLLDYYKAHTRALEQSIGLFARTVKQASDGKALVAVAHGSLQRPWLLEDGHGALEELLAAEHCDLWTAAPQLDRRGHGQHGAIPSLNASLKAHGKLWLSESDIRTSATPPAHDNPARHGRPPDLEASLACLEREFGHLLCEGATGAWTPRGEGWYTHPRIGALFQRMQLVGRAARAFDRRADTDVAAVVHLDSLFAMPDSPVASALLDGFRTQELCRIGTPCDFWALGDLLKPDAARYKLYILLNPFALAAAERQRIRERLARDGATLVWMYAPGLIQPDAQPPLSLAHAKALTGIALDSETGADLSLQMKLTPEGARYAEGFEADRVFGDLERPRWARGKAVGSYTRETPEPRRWRQRFVAGEQGVEPLARFVQGDGIAIALRRDAKATHIWIGSVTAPADLLRAIARRAGCHLHYDGDETLYASRSFLCIHTHNGGGRIFRLRRPADVVNVLTGKPLAHHATDFVDDIPPYRTRLYFLGDAKAWEQAMAQSAAWLDTFRTEHRRRRAESSN